MQVGRPVFTASSEFPGAPGPGCGLSHVPKVGRFNDDPPSIDGNLEVPQSATTFTRNRPKARSTQVCGESCISPNSVQNFEGIQLQISHYLSVIEFW